MKPETGIVTHHDRSVLPGVLSFVSAMVALFSFIMITLTSLMPDFNPPGWIRIVTMVPLPLALTASVALGVAALVKQTGRIWAICGLIVSAIVIVGFVVLLNVAG